MKRLYWLDTSSDKVRVVENPTFPNTCTYQRGLSFANMPNPGERSHIAWAECDMPIRSIWLSDADGDQTSDVLFTIKAGERFEYVT